MSTNLDQTGTKLSPNVLAAQWWQGMQDFNHDGKRNFAADRGALARLRRASVVQAQTDEAVMALYRKIWGNSFFKTNMDKAVRLALVLAHVRDESATGLGATGFGAALGAGGEEAAFKNLRFRQLLQAQGNDEIVRAFRRAVAMLGHTAKVADLACVLLNFEDDKARTRFAFDYFGAHSQKSA